MKKKLFIGIDLNQDRAMITFFHEGMKAMETISTVQGEDRCQIPTAVFCTGQGNYFYGEEAIKRQDRQDGTFYTDLYARSLIPEEAEHRDMLVQFIRRLLKFRERYQHEEMEPYLAVTVPELSDETVALFDFVRDELEFLPDHFQLMDYRESFFAYVYHQDSSIYLHDTAIFDFCRDRITSTVLHSDGYGKIKRVSAVKKEWPMPDYVSDDDAKDAVFVNIIRESFTKRIISAVYFTGDGFDGEWMRESLRVIGAHKRVFKGNNLYTMGACYAGYRNVITEGWNYYFDSEYKLQGELSLKVMRGKDPCFLRLTRLGENWFTPTETYYFLYDDDPVLETWLRVRQQMSAKITSFTLDYLPDRPSRSIRLGVQAVPLSGSEVILRVWDDGFGEIFESSGKLWEFPIHI